MEGYIGGIALPTKQKGQGPGRGLHELYRLSTVKWNDLRSNEMYVQQKFKNVISKINFLCLFSWKKIGFKLFNLLMQICQTNTLKVLKVSYKSFRKMIQSTRQNDFFSVYLVINKTKNFYIIVQHFLLLWEILKRAFTSIRPSGANPIKLFTPLGKFTNPS